MPCRRSRIGGITPLMMLSVGTERSEREGHADVYARHAGELVRFATVLAGPSGADDLVASAVVKAFTNPGWPDVQNQRAYLFRAVLNEARETFPETVVPRDFDVIEIPFPERGGPSLVKGGALQARPEVVSSYPR